MNYLHIISKCVKYVFHWESLKYLGKVENFQRIKHAVIWIIYKFLSKLNQANGKQS